jgi:hypothetical protein
MYSIHRFRTDLVPKSEPPMTGKAYYLTTLANWHRHAPRFANSHFIVLAAPAVSSVGAQSANSSGRMPGAALPQRDHISTGTFEKYTPQVSAEIKSLPGTSDELPLGSQASLPGTACCAPTTQGEMVATGAHDAAISILVLIEADEGVHLSLDDDPTFEPLPHPLAQKPISDAAQSALAPHGVAPGATTFDAAEALARVHPLLRHRVF